MRAAGLLDLVETRIDGVVSAEIGLKGKPEADIFTTAADRLGCSYDRSIVVEDAVSGVAAGKMAALDWCWALPAKIISQNCMIMVPISWWKISRSKHRKL